MQTQECSVKQTRRETISQKRAALFKRIHKSIIDSFVSHYQSKKIKLTPINIEYSNDYFGFLGENAICEFFFDEFRNWKFGVWLSSHAGKKPYGDPHKYTNTLSNASHVKYQVFAQHALNIDKFKPSSSIFCSSGEIYLEPVYHDVGPIVVGFKQEVVNRKTRDFSGEIIKLGEDLTAESFGHVADEFNLLFTEHYLAFYRERTAVSFNIEYVSKRKAKKFYFKSLKSYVEDEKIRMRDNKSKIEAIKNIIKSKLKNDLSYEIIELPRKTKEEVKDFDSMIITQKEIDGLFNEEPTPAKKIDYKKKYIFKVYMTMKEYIDYSKWIAMRIKDISYMRNKYQLSRDTVDRRVIFKVEDMKNTFNYYKEENKNGN